MVEIQQLNITQQSEQQLKPTLQPSAIQDTNESWMRRDMDSVIHGRLMLDQHKGGIVFKSCGEKGNAELIDVEGNSYLDAFSGLGNTSLGYNKEYLKEIAETAYQQFITLPFTSLQVHYANVPAILCAEKILHYARDVCGFTQLDKVFFSSGGSECIESAIHASLLYWQSKGKSSKRKIISFNNCYHGATFAVSSLSEMQTSEFGYERILQEERTLTEKATDALFKVGEIVGLKASKSGLHEVINVTFPHRFTYEDEFGKIPKDDSEVADQCAEQLEAVIQQIGADNIAAFVFEPLQGDGGGLDPVRDYFSMANYICKQNDILMIADEIMAGFGKTGKWFALANDWGFKDIDVICFSKGVNSGLLPLGGAIFRKEIYDELFASHPNRMWWHDYTNGGNAVCHAVALKVFEIYERDRLFGRVFNLGNRIRDLLKERLSDFSLFRGVTGTGGMIGVWLKQPISGQLEMILAHKHKIYCHKTRNEKAILMNIIFTMEEENIDRIVNAFYDGFRELESQQ